MDQKTKIEMKDSICVFDFDGYTVPGHFHVSTWADYFPINGIVVFGGEWNDIPDWIIDHEPTEEEVTTHVERIQNERHQGNL